MMKAWEVGPSNIKVTLTIIMMAGMSLVNIVQAQTLSDEEIRGIWWGTIKYSGAELRMVFTISKGKDDGLRATLDVPDQNATNIPVDEVVYDGNTVRFIIKPIDGVFDGKIIEDGKKIDGKWTQGDMSLKLVLERTDSAPVVKRPQEPKEPFSYQVEDVVFKNDQDGITLAGTLTTPRSEGTFPAVLLLSGSGAQDRDESVFGHRPFLILADYLTRKGIAVLRADDRGVGGSTGDFSEATAVDFAADAMAGIRYLKSRKEINHRLIGLVGHSEGGMIAPIVATQSPDIAFIVLIASPGLPIEKMEYVTESSILKADGASDAFIAKRRSMRERLISVIKRETDCTAVLDKFKPIITRSFQQWNEEERKISGLSEEILDTYIHDQAQRMHSPWYRYYLTYDPGEVLKKVACPVLAINGEKDVQVPAQVNLHAIKRALKNGGNNNYRIEVLPDLNHLLQTAETGCISEYGRIEETMSPKALKIIADWILENTQGS